jgi:murein tripeptide amidase MpaA
MVPAAVRRLLLLVGLLAGGSVQAQQLAVTRVRLDSLATLETLARAGFEVSGVERLGGVDYAVVVATPAERAALVAQGLEAVAAVPAPAAPPVNFHDYGAITSAVEALVASGRPVFVDTIGRTGEGRPILAVKIGAADDAPERPNVLYLGAHHAREWISAEMTLRLIEYLADSLAATPAGAALLTARDVWVIPVVNPDGYQYTFDGDRLWRKNRRLNADGSRGVDLNRNYPAFWGVDDFGSSPVPSAETYRGPGPASEPETQAIVAFHQGHPPDVAISYHSYSDLILYPYGFTFGRIPADAPEFTTLAGTPLVSAILDRLPETARTRYHPGPAWQLYPTNGEYAEWAYRTYGTMAFTVELTAGCCVGGAAYDFLLPDDSATVARIVSDNLPFALGRLQDVTDLKPGGTAIDAQLESAWPEIWLSAAPGPTTRVIEVGVGADRRTVSLASDSLDRGRLRWRWRGALDRGAAGLRLAVPELGLRQQVVVADGAESSSSGWSGWGRDSVGPIEGARYWAGARDTLTSPDLTLSGVTGARLVFWTRHAGSLFLPDRFGEVDYSLDGGVSWTPLAIVEGSAPDWYPVGAPLPAVEPLRLRFESRDMPWDVDAIQILGTPILPDVAIAQGALEVSENPVRSDRVFFTWSPAADDGRLSIFTFTGALVYRAAVAGADGQAAWDLVNTAGAAVGNGGYVVVLELGEAVMRRRLFVARAR